MPEPTCFVCGGEPHMAIMFTPMGLSHGPTTEYACMPDLSHALRHFADANDMAELFAREQLRGRDA